MKEFMNTVTDPGIKDRKIRPKVISSDTGKLFHVHHATTVLKYSNEDSLGQFSILQSIVQRDEGPDFHRHINEDIFYYNLKGDYEFYCNGKSYLSYQGSCFFLPKGTVQKYTNIGNATGSLLCFYIPGGFENFLEEISHLPNEVLGREDYFNQIALKHGLDFLDNGDFPSSTQPIFLQRQDGTLECYNGCERISKLTKGHTDKAIAVFEVYIKPKESYNYRNDNSNLIIYILAGRFSVEIDDKREDATSGYLCVVPKESSYSLKNTGWNLGALLYITF